MKTLSILLLSALVMASCIGTDVIEDQVTTISILPDEGELVNGSDISGLVGAEKFFNASATNDRGKTFVPQINWTSSNPAVASISNDGFVRLLTRGNTVISASGYNIQSNNINLSVRADETEAAIISFAEVNNTLAVGESIQLMADVLNADGNVIDDVTIEWSSSNEEIFSVSENGLVTSLAEGSATITARVDETTGSITFSTSEATTKVRLGEFRGINGYRAEGNTELVEANGELTLSLLDNFSTSNGPGLYLYLSNNESSISGGIEVGELRNNSGADSYAVPAGITFSQYSHVIIYCKPFGVGFATAALED